MWKYNLITKLFPPIQKALLVYHRFQTMVESEVARNFENENPVLIWHIACIYARNAIRN